MTEHRVIVDALNIDYPAARVVNNLSFTLGNERLALVGESGSGKSMSARALLGLVRKPGIVSAKRLNVLGNDLLTLNSRRWQAARQRHCDGSTGPALRAKPGENRRRPA